METLTKKELKTKMIKDAQAYNIFLTFDYLKRKSLKEVMRFLHPFDRGFWERSYPELIP